MIRTLFKGSVLGLSFNEPTQQTMEFDWTNQNKKKPGICVQNIKPRNFIWNQKQIRVQQFEEESPLWVSMKKLFQETWQVDLQEKNYVICRGFENTNTGFLLNLKKGLLCR